ncbi:MAG TPA: T9SS type A sorting domain-containing protein [Segetibacter sp.]
MKAVYTFTLAVFISVSAFAQEYPTNQTGNNTTAVQAKLSDFEAFRNANTINIFWTALAESNMASHVVERSANGSSFSNMGTLVAQNSASPLKYSFIDAAPIEGVNYYRLRTTDKRGVVTYSKILEVDNGFRKTEVRVISNPVRGGVMNLQINNINSGKYYIALYSNGGQQVFAQSMNLTSGSSTETINLPQSLASGSYFLQVNNGQTRINKQVLLQ